MQRTSIRWILLVLLGIYIAFALFIPAMQSIFGFGLGTLLAIVILLYFVYGNRGVGGPPGPLL